MKKPKHPGHQGLTGCGPVDRVSVVGVRERSTNHVAAQVVDDSTSETLERVIRCNILPGTRIYTDNATA